MCIVCTAILTAPALLRGSGLVRMRRVGISAAAVYICVYTRLSGVVLYPSVYRFDHFMRCCFVWYVHSPSPSSFAWSVTRPFTCLAVADCLNSHIHRCVYKHAHGIGQGTRDERERERERERREHTPLPAYHVPLFPPRSFHPLLYSPLSLTRALLSLVNCSACLLLFPYFPGLVLACLLDG
ncbi:uncharacterized protein J3D65DRAFT_75714 [Phyllosticta citribraziliensis]|uniref:Uncharacterized protein n=1 Tax=Phyllosticta citribraziliensis TaxID=989973 RepID=A0ABR1LF33_9PEZI